MCLTNDSIFIILKNADYYDIHDLRRYLIMNNHKDHKDQRSILNFELVVLALNLHLVI